MTESTTKQTSSPEGTNYDMLGMQKEHEQIDTETKTNATTMKLSENSTISVLVPETAEVDMNINGFTINDQDEDEARKENFDYEGFMKIQSMSNDDPKISNTYEINSKSKASLFQEVDIDHVTVTSTPASITSEIKASEPLSANTLDPYHPAFLFCGECSSCTPSAPPPVLDFNNPNLFTLSKPAPSGKYIKPHKTITVKKVDIENNNNGATHNIEMTALDDSKASIPHDYADSRCSRFKINNFTEQSQILAINAMIQPLPGVSKILTNIEEKLVLIDHDPFTTSAIFISRILINRGGYQVEILWDAGTSISDTSNPSGTCKSSIVVVAGLCCNTEVPALKQILKNIDGVKKVTGVNITIRTVYIEHDPFVVSAQELVNHLNIEGFISKVKRDGSRQISRQKPAKLTHSIVPTDIEMVPLGDTDRSSSHGITKDSPLSSQPSSNDHHSAPLPPPLSFRQSSTYVESTIRIANLSSLAHVNSMEHLFKEANSQKRHETGKKLMIRAFHPHPPSRTIRIEHDANYISASDIAIMLREDNVVGAVELLEDGAELGRFVHVSEDMMDGEDNRNEDMNGSSDGSLKMNVILSGVFWLGSMMSLFGGRWTNMEYFGLLSVVFGLPPIANKACRTLKRGQFDANCMMLTAALGAVALKEYDEAASVAFLFAVSELLEVRTTSRARNALNSIINIRPDSANVVNEATKEITIGVPSERVTVGAVVCVRTGDKVPCDGIVVEGSTIMDESSLTGEARPAQKNVDDPVLGGTINIGDSPVLIRTTCTMEDSAVTRLIRLVEEAQANRSPTEKLVDSFAKKYTPTICFMALLMCTIPWAWGVEAGRYWALNGLIIIVIACPCALTISTPVTYSAGLAATAQQGVIVKGGARLEALGRVKKVVFDKTGTLTKGKFEMKYLSCIGNKCSRKEILELLVVMEAPSSHPLSTTLLKAAKAENITIPKDTVLRHHKILEGEGVTGIVNGHEIFVGNRRLFERLKLYEQMPEVDKFMVEHWNNSGGTVGFVGKQDIGIVGAFCVMDTVREEAREVIESLQKYGIEVVMLTGDAEGAAMHVGEQVGLSGDEIQFQLRPDDKLHFIGSLKGARTASGWCRDPNLILMCGDGVNDAPALAVSDIGVAMGSGAALALEMSDVTLMDSNLKKLLFSVKMGKRTIWAIQENILISLLIKTFVVIFTFLGWMTLFAAIAADVGVMLIVTLNGMKLLPSKTDNWEHLVENDTSYRKGIGRILQRKKKKNFDLVLPMERDIPPNIV